MRELKINPIMVVALAVLLPASLAAKAEVIKTFEIDGDDKGYLGVYPQELDEAMLEALDFDGEGVLISDVVNKGPADAAGIKTGDILMTFDGGQITSPKQLQRMVARTKPGDKVKLAVLRNGKKQTIDVTLGKREARRYVIRSGEPHGLKDHRGFIQVSSLPDLWIGVHLDQLGEQLAEYFEVKEGEGLLVTNVEDDSPAEKGGIIAGDVIVKIEGKKIHTVDDIHDLLRDHEEDDKIEVTVTRKGDQKSLKITLESRPDDSYHCFNGGIIARKVEKYFDQDGLKKTFENFDFDIRIDKDELSEIIEELRDDVEKLKQRLDKLER